MEKKYLTLKLDKAYRLLNSGAVGIICSRSQSGKYNLAPIAWMTPVEYEPATRVVIVLDKENCTCKNILETQEYAIAIPHLSQLEMVKKLGSTTGKTHDKISYFDIPTFPAKLIDVKLPEGCIAYLECKLYKKIDDDSVMLLMAEVLHAQVLASAFDRRLLAEKKEGKTLHHLGGNVFVTSSDVIY
ncbi:MAG: flavin reductase family protein [Bacteroidales bacterium]|nr:flavin reductase family protein [Bacteroidales bacterium]